MKGCISLRLQFGCNRRPKTSRCDIARRKGECPIKSLEECPLGSKKLARNSQSIIRPAA